jgi:hypothetical protein
MAILSRLPNGGKDTLLQPDTIDTQSTHATPQYRRLITVIGAVYRDPEGFQSPACLDLERREA